MLLLAYIRSTRLHINHCGVWSVVSLNGECSVCKARLPGKLGRLVGPKQVSTLSPVQSYRYILVRVLNKVVWMRSIYWCKWMFACWPINFCLRVSRRNVLWENCWCKVQTVRMSVKWNGSFAIISIALVDPSKQTKLPVASSKPKSGGRSQTIPIHNNYIGRYVLMEM